MNLKGIIISFLSTHEVCAFVQYQSMNHHHATSIHAKKPKKSSPARGFGKGFGKKNDPMKKTYDFTPAAVDSIDQKEAMEEFFKSYSDWHPLFASIATDSKVPASAHVDLSSSGSEQNADIVFDDAAPWVKLPGVPSGPDKESDLEIISLVLDNLQKGLTDIPVSEKLYTKDAEDNNDLHFLEEGRRLLVLQRFNVIGGGGVDNLELFRTCWSEIHHLVTEGAEDNGSLIILDDMDDDLDLDNFVETKIRVPLQFLGLGDLIEVASLQRGRNCVRLIHQLGAMASLEERDREIEGFQ